MLGMRVRVGNVSYALVEGEKKIGDKHVQSIGADDEEGGEHEDGT